jgi:hypothetical protein
MMKDVAVGEETTKIGHRDLILRLFPERLVDRLVSEIVRRELNSPSEFRIFLAGLKPDSKNRIASQAAKCHPRSL